MTAPYYSLFYECNSANYDAVADWNGETGGNVTSVGGNGKSSFFGTYDQNGNVLEIIDHQPDPSLVTLYGGSYATSTANYNEVNPISISRADVGFRICANISQATFFDTVIVSGTGNINNTDGLGKVNDLYKISTFLVTNTEYVEFLNSVAASGTNTQINSAIWPYKKSMAFSNRGGIEVSGYSPNISYSVKTNFEHKPVNFVNWYSAARYVNWLHNNRPDTGGLSLNSTESGVYYLNFTNSSTIPSGDNKNSYWIPDRNEWIKAAYYDIDKNNSGEGYWEYATQSDEIPYKVSSDDVGVANNTPDFSLNGISFCVTPTQTPTVTPTYSPTPSVTASATPTPTVTTTQTSTVTPTVTATPTTTPTTTPTNTASPTITPTVTKTPSSTPTRTPTRTPTVTPSASATPTLTPTNTSSPTVTPTPSKSLCPSVYVGDIIYNKIYTNENIKLIYKGFIFDGTINNKQTLINGGQGSLSDITLLLSESPDASQTPTPTVTSTPTSTPTVTPSNSQTPSVTPTNTATPTNTVTTTSTNTPTPSVTASVTPSQTPTTTSTPTTTPSNTPTTTVTSTPTVTPTNTSSPTTTPTVTTSPTTTPTNTITPSVTPSVTETPTNTPTVTATPTVTPTSGIFGPLSNTVNYLGSGNWNGSTSGNVTTVGTNGGPSYYGTYDQNGNVSELTYDFVDSIGYGILLGGAFDSANAGSLKTIEIVENTSTENNFGFRLVSSGNPLNLSNFINISDTGNISDNNNRGSVSYEYSISQYPVTNCDYIQFLNAIATQSDPNNVYNTAMSGDPNGGISRQGSEPPYTYSLKADFDNKPINFVSLENAFRYCNWLHNDKPIGIQGSSTTEDGAYILQPVGINQEITVIPQPQAKYKLPNIDEWIKAAYYSPRKNGWNNPGYWNYATQNDTAPEPVCANASGVGMLIISDACSETSANFSNIECTFTPTTTSTPTPTPTPTTSITPTQTETPTATPTVTPTTTTTSTPTPTETPTTTPTTTVTTTPTPSITPTVTETPTTTPTPTPTLTEYFVPQQFIEIIP